MTHVDPFRLAVPSRRLVCTYGVRSPRDRTRRLAPKLVGLGLVRLGGKERGAGGWTTSSSAAAAAAAMSSSQLPLLSWPQISSPFAHPSRPYSSQPSNLSPSSSSSSQQPTSTIKSLMRSPLLFSSSAPSTAPSSSPSESRPPGFPPPKHTIVLCHGLYGYGVRGKPGGEIHYWAHVHEVLVGCGAEVLVVEVPSKGSIVERAQVLHATLEKSLPPGTPVNFLAHSMGGLDCRHLITHIKKRSYVVKSLTCVATPHRGSPFMDWCKATIGLGTPLESLAQALTSPRLIPAWSLPVPLLSPMLPTPPLTPPSSPSSTSTSLSSLSSSPPTSPSSPALGSPSYIPPSSSDPRNPSNTPPPSPSSSSPSSTSYFSFLSLTPLLQSFALLRDRLLQLCDSPAYYNLTTSYLNDVFNPATPDSPDVKYFSIAARATSVPPIHPLFYTKMILDETARSGQAERDGWAGERYEGNDAMVSVSSAKWGEFLGIVDDCNHWDLRARNNFLERLIFRFPLILTPSFSPSLALTDVYAPSHLVPSSSSSYSTTSTTFPPVIETVRSDETTIPLPSSSTTTFTDTLTVSSILIKPSSPLSSSFSSSQQGKEGKLKAPIVTSPSPSNPNPATNPDSAATTTTTTTSPPPPSTSSTSRPPSIPPPPTPSLTTSELHSPPPSSGPSEAWTLPDINASLTTYIDSTRRLLPSFGSSTSSPSPPTSPSPSSSSPPSSSSSSSSAAASPLDPSTFTSPPSPSSKATASAAAATAQAAQAESESRFSSALASVASYLPSSYGSPFGWFASSSSSSSSSSSKPAKDEGASGQESRGGGRGEEGKVDEGLREKKEGKKERFELDRFYRAIMLNLSNNGL